MIITIIAWIYITCICYGWGQLIFRSAQKITATGKHYTAPFSVICFTGLAAIAGVSGIVSIFLPLGIWQLQLFLILPCLPLFYRMVEGRRPSFSFRSLHPVVILLLICSFSIVLIMSTWTISHPDSIVYHIQMIQWSEKYRVIPGLAHLDIHLGFQNLWFPVCALLSFHFTTMGSYFFLNTVIVIWYLYFVCIQINGCLYKRNFTPGFLWTALLALSIWSYTQIRLTVTSASPDFIVTLYLWLIFYMLQSSVMKQYPARFMLLILLTSFVICIKLSALPVVIVALYAAWKLIVTRNVRALLVTGVAALLIFGALLTRNIITTGYLLFPSTFPDIINPDWKLKETDVVLTKKYITTYARTQSGFSKEEVEKSRQLTPAQWLPVWWSHRSTADKIIMLLCLTAMSVLFFQSKNLIRAPGEIKIILITSLTGIIFWFIEAPDPRFGFGFIIPFMGLVYLLQLKRNANVSFLNRSVNKINLISLAAGCMIFVFYIGYRYTNYFDTAQIVQPLGIKNLPYHQDFYSGIIFNIPDGDTACGDIPVPCFEGDPRQYVILRGSTIIDGFKSVSE